MDQRNNRHFADVITGAKCDFWPDKPGARTRYDAEQYLPIFDAVHRACKAIGATPAQRWAIVEAELEDLATQYAADMQETSR